jgi:hypothetical protein
LTKGKGAAEMYMDTMNRGLDRSIGKRKRKRKKKEQGEEQGAFSEKEEVTDVEKGSFPHALAS